MRYFPLLLALVFLNQPAVAQVSPSVTSSTSPKPSVNSAPSTTPSHPATPTSPPPTATNTAVLQSTIDHLTQLNQQQLDILKKQQALIEDMQYDQRIQRRQSESLIQRLEETLQENAQLKSQVAHLESAPSTPSPTVAVAPAPTPVPQPAPPPPPPPSTYLPPSDPAWHRLFTLSGTDGKSTDIFHVQGHTWRVLWHNLDKPEKVYQNTSALFVNAFPKDDTIPQKVCAKVGTGGDATELIGPGNYYLKIEASGGSWELAVEDSR